MKKESVPLILGMLLPITLVVGFLIFIYTPRLFINPEYNFLYTEKEYSYNRDDQVDEYSIVDNKLVYKGDEEKDHEIYLYNVKKQTSNQISLEEAQTYYIEAGPSSPDGYLVEYQYNHNGIFEIFGSSNNRGYYLVNDKSKQRLLGLNTRYYNDEFELLGWINN
jgi:hypothetical protein